MPAVVELLIVQLFPEGEPIPALDVFEAEMNSSKKFRFGPALRVCG
jgi:hypothetical protein